MYELREELGSQNWDNMGIFGTQEKLNLLAKNLEDIQERYEKIRIPNSNEVMNTAFTDYVELGNLILLSCCACLAARNRLESRGVHTREDYPKRDDKNFLKHSIVNLENDELKLSYKDVMVTEYSLDVKESAMKIIIDRFNDKEKYEQSYDIDDKDIQGKTLLSLLLFIKKTKDITNFTAS